jgi:ADP-ribosylglycohydrolase
MQAAAELRALAVAMRREVLARRYTDDSPEQIDARLREWGLRPEPVPRRLYGSSTVARQ